jgi:hypothetical protein
MRLPLPTHLSTNLTSGSLLTPARRGDLRVQHQKARSFELRAALALARLYQSTGRPTEAHAVLGPALEGFMPEIAEAKALFDELA